MNEQRALPDGRRSSWSGLRVRLLVFFLLLSLVPLFLSSAVGYLRSTGIIADLVGHHLSGIADAQALHVRDQVDRHRLSLQAVEAGNSFLVAAALGLQGHEAGRMGDVATLEAVQEHLDRKREELSAFHELHLLGTDGRHLAASPAGRLDPPPALPLVPGEPSVAIQDARPGEVPAIHVAVPVRDDVGATIGYLAGSMPLGGASEFLDLPPHVAGSIESFVLDGVGRPLFVSHPHGHVDFARPIPTPLRGMPPGSIARYRNGEGVEVIATTVAIPGRPWLLLTEAPVAEALSELRDLRLLAIVLGSSFALLVAVLAWIVAGGIVAPLRRLVAATRRVGRGELDVRVDVEQPDEIGELGRAFNEMTLDLSRVSRRATELHQREMERAGQLATVGELASGVAHEIKNPVVGISNGLDLVLRKTHDDAELEPIADEMKRQLRRIEGAVRDLLAFARPPEPSPVRVDGRRVLERAVRLVEPAADRAGVDLFCECGSARADFLADEELVRQALVNLLMNAVQATGAGGRVGVEIGTEEEEVVFRVRDTGRGIPPDDLEHVFKPFYTTRHAGTGLGLSITRDIVERHGGRIEVASVLGGGSTFVVRFPASGAPPDGKARGAPPSLASRGAS